MASSESAQPFSNSFRPTKYFFFKKFKLGGGRNFFSEAPFWSEGHLVKKTRKRFLKLIWFWSNTKRGLSIFLCYAHSLERFFFMDILRHPCNAGSSGGCLLNMRPLVHDLMVLDVVKRFFSRKSSSHNFLKKLICKTDEIFRFSTGKSFNIEHSYYWHFLQNNLLLLFVWWVGDWTLHVGIMRRNWVCTGLKCKS